jgi:3-hydroxybutyrate dehydrogenase
MFIGKTALVTGSTSGIGLGIAQTLAAQGASVVLNGFGNTAEVERLRADLAERHGVEVRYDAADMTRPGDIETMIGKALSEFGCIDLLINNAGIQHVAPVEDFPVDKWYAILAINLSASFHTVRLALPAMRRRGFGRIVNIASAHALVASRTSRPMSRPNTASPASRRPWRSKPPRPASPSTPYAPVMC